MRAIVIVLALSLSACSMRTHQIAFVSANVADVYTSQRAFTNGHSEANVLMPESLGGMVAVKAASTVSMLWLADVLRDRGKSGVSKALLTAASVALGIVSARNYAIGGRK